MGFFQTCYFPLNFQFSTAFLIFFLILASSHSRFMSQGGSSSKLIDNYTQMERRSLLIGSRPPRCEKRYCRNCGHCEAVQVPIVPKKFIRITQQALSTTSKSLYYSRGDDISNYKPMCWKCKCGDLIFNP
uniref:EPIDERMAL PATTERNING FACTOR-like protein 2 n=1 Tax=Erigeron canadensis TaxID=72917 RepID=UPI001CB90560|nr:EPIDERMAL PATTERNING FACTOR-like protein 2 [Erigeron canadensis]